MVLRISVVSYQRQDEEPLGVSPGLLCRTVDLGGQEALVIYVHVGIGMFFSKKQIILARNFTVLLVLIAT